MRAATAGPILNAVYWALPLILAVILARLDVISKHGIRYEELAESVRNVYWLDHRLIYDGVYSNVGWYGTLLAVYKIFGFSLFQAKLVKLALHLIGLYAAAALLRRSMPLWAAILPLVIIGLSPSLLYFQTLQVSFGIDLPYAALCLWLIFGMRPGRQSGWELAKTGACAAIAMVAAMSYPTFLLYLPSLLALFAWRWRCEMPPEGARSWAWLSGHAAVAVVGALAPLAAALLFVRNPMVLFLDPATHAGLFRAGGQLGFDPPTMWNSIVKILSDIFVRGGSYYFDVSRPDLSGVMAQVGFVVVVLTLGYLTVTKAVDRMVALAIALLAVLSLLVPSLAIDGEPGIRRSTGLLAAYFVSVALVCRFYVTHVFQSRWLGRIGLSLCVLLPVDALLKLPSLVDNLGRKNTYQNYDWFAIGPTPSASLDRLLASVDAGKALTCPVDADGIMVPCRYQEVYAALAGYKKWNGLGAGEIQAIDWKTGRPIALTPYLWVDKYYPTCTRQAACLAEMAEFYEKLRQEKARRAAGASPRPPGK